MILLAWLIESFADLTRESGNRVVYTNGFDTIKIWQNPTKYGTFFGASDPEQEAGNKQFLWLYANDEDADKPASAMVKPEAFAGFTDIFAEDFDMSFENFCTENKAEKKAEKKAVKPSTEKAVGKRKVGEKATTTTAKKTVSRRRTVKPPVEEPATAPVEEPAPTAKRRTRKATTGKTKLA